jgi:CxxC motif-containing protein
MPDAKEFVCIGCPVGCPLQLAHEGDEIIEVAGHDCRRGEKYAKQEFLDPRRSLSTTVAISGAVWARLPVKTTGQVPKDRVMEAARAIHRIHCHAPVEMGQVLMEGLLGEAGLDVIATRSMARMEDTDSTPGFATAPDSGTPA